MSPATATSAAKSKKFERVGNAVPPGMAGPVLREVIGAGGPRHVERTSIA